MVESEAEEDDDEIEIEFYEMEDAVVETEPVVKEEVEEIKIERRPRVTDPTSILSSVKEDDDDLEFIDFE